MGVNTTVQKSREPVDVRAMLPAVVSGAGATSDVDVTLNWKEVR